MAEAQNKNPQLEAPQDISLDDLSKTIKSLEAMMAKSTPKGRKEFLTEKAQTSSLTEEESAEFIALLSGKEVQESSVSKDIHSAYKDNDNLQKAVTYEVSGYLDDHLNSTVSAHTAVGDAVESLTKSQNEQFLLVYRALHSLSSAVQHLSKAHNVQKTVEVAPPQAIQTTAVVEKTFPSENYSQQPDAPITLDQLGDAIEEMYTDVKAGKLKRIGQEDVMKSLAAISLGQIDTIDPVIMQEAEKRIRVELN